MRPQLLLDLHSTLLDACSFLHDCTPSGCADLLARLRVETCLKGDRIIIAGIHSDLSYILTDGVLQVSHPNIRNSKLRAILGDACGVGGRKLSRRVPHDRVDRPGTLIGFYPPFQPRQPARYTVHALTRATFVAISRDDLAEVLQRNLADVPVLVRAMQHAAKLLSPDKRRLPPSIGSCHAGLSDAALESTSDATAIAAATLRGSPQLRPNEGAMGAARPASSLASTTNEPFASSSSITASAIAMGRGSSESSSQLSVEARSSEEAGQPRASMRTVVLASKAAASARQYNRRSSSHSIVSEGKVSNSQQEEALHLAVLHEAVEQGWLPRGGECGDDRGGREGGLEWRQAREHAERELFGEVAEVKNLLKAVLDATLNQHKPPSAA